MADSTEKRKLEIMNVILGLHGINYNSYPYLFLQTPTFPTLQALVASPVGIFHYNIHSRYNSTQDNVFYFACNTVKAE